MVNIKTYEVVENEHLYGPGRRLLIFMQGCTLHCYGCINPHLWPFNIGTNITKEEILTLCEKLDGVTFQGGEPLDQAKNLFDIFKFLKNHGKSIILFTGYIKKELNKDQKRVWDLADIVVAGRFISKKRNIYLQFRGSTNQRVYTHKGKYKNYKITDGSTVSIIRINNDGIISARGYEDTRLTDFKNSLKK